MNIEFIYEILTSEQNEEIILGIGLIPSLDKEEKSNINQLLSKNYQYHDWWKNNSRSWSNKRYRFTIEL